MSRIIYSVAASLDGFHTAADGSYEWAVPDEEVMAALDEDARSVSTYLYGRRMYESMAPWETDPETAAQSPQSKVFAETWRAAHKVVFSSTLGKTWTERTRLERELSVEAVARSRAEATGDLTVEGPTLAHGALRLGVVDIVELLICPVTVGAGNRALPEGWRSSLKLTRQRRFSNGMVQMSYDVSSR